MRIDDFLRSRQVSFERLPHRPAFTANRVAQALHVKGKDVAKTVLLRTGHGHLLAVVPATHHIDLDRVREELGEEHVDMAPEADMDQLFPDCERGAMPPFGSLYNLPTVVYDSLTHDDDIVFEGQTHEEAIRMSYRDFEAVEQPRHGRFASP